MRGSRLAGLGLLVLAVAGAVPGVAPGGAWAQARGPGRPAAAAAAVLEKPMALRLETAVALRGAGGRWGAPVVDELNRRLYLPRGVAGLTVLSLDGFRQLAEVADTAGSAAVALDPETLRGFSANAFETKPGAAAASGITVFDQRNFKPVGSVKLGGVRQVLYDAATRQVVAAGEDGTLTLVDPAKLEVTATLPLEGKRVTALAADRRGRVFAALADRDAIAVVNMVDRSVAATWRPDGCRQPVALAFDVVGMRLLVACRGGRAGGGAVAAEEAVMVLDPYGGKPLGRLAAPPLVDSVIHDPVHRLLYLASGSAAMVMVYRQPDPFRYEALETAGTRPLAGLGAVDAKGGRLILAAAEYVAVAARADGARADGARADGARAGETRILANSFTLLAMKRLPLE